MGSGNIGTTNVLRTGRKDLAAATLLLDGGKGAAAVLLAGLYGPDTALMAALGAVLGHLFPVWLKFRGGKGVATTFGVFPGARLAGRPRRLRHLAAGRRRRAHLLGLGAGRPRRSRRSTPG